METLFILSLALVAGLVFTRVMKLVNLPNVTGYLIAGLLLGPSVFNLINGEALESMAIIVKVALGFVAFSIGSSFKLEHLKELGKSVVIITFCQAFAAVILVDIALFIMGVPAPIAITLGAIATATAPAATLMVVRQYKAKGIVTNTLLPVVAFDDAIGLMVFSISVALAKVLAMGGVLTVEAALVEPILEIGLSLAVGAGCGIVLALASRIFKSRSNRITLIIAIVFLSLGLSVLLHLSDLLVCMMIGAVYTNGFKEYSKPLDVLDRWTYPLYMLFFIMSGAELNLAVVPTVGAIGVVYIIVRSIGKYGGAALGAMAVKADKNVVKYLGLTLLPQAGVAIGMATIARTELPEYGTLISTVVLCATLIYELFGPVLTRYALAKSGEIKPEMLKQKKVKAVEAVK